MSFAADRRNMAPVPSALQRSRFLNLAHRGASASAPENTCAAFEAAIEADATAIEMDLRVTSDGHVVLMHDATVDRTTDGTGAVAEMTLAQIRKLDAGLWFADGFRQEQVPTLEEVFERIVPRAAVVLDAKQSRAGIEEKVVELARRHDAVEQVTVSSRLGPLLARVKALEPALETGFLAYFFDWGWWMRYVAHRMNGLGTHTVSPKGSTVTPEMVHFFHERGHLVRAWGVERDEELAARLIRMGVDGMSFDQPDRLWELWTEQMEEEEDG